MDFSLSLKMTAVVFFCCVLQAVGSPFLQKTLNDKCLSFFAVATPCNPFGRYAQNDKILVILINLVISNTLCVINFVILSVAKYP